MTASFSVTLDTHGPVLDAGLGQWNPASRVLTIPFTTDEPATITGYYTPFNNPSVGYPVFAVGGALVANLPVGVDGGNGRAHVMLTDSVLNSSAYSITIGRQRFATTVSVKTVSMATGRSAIRSSSRPRFKIEGYTPSSPTTIRGPRR